ncbi:MAG: flagellar basal body-associated FliL family protein [Alphaproteobacteria bacterium]|nr:flagellar basal body-associated FliL family protein [Alphaproteobacteria bacterium]
MAGDKNADKDKAKAKEADAKTEGKEGEAPAEAAPAKKKGLLGFIPAINLSRKTLMFVVAPAVLVVVLGLGAYMFLFSGGEEEAAVAEGAHGEAGHGAEGAHGEGVVHPVFYDVPDILVNVATGEQKPAFLKLSVSLELEGEAEAAKAAIEPVMPRVVDQLQTYLRELRVEDLTGSASVFRLKEEMLRRVNLAVEPVKVKDVLFREMIIQ